MAAAALGVRLRVAMGMRARREMMSYQEALTDIMVVIKMMIVDVSTSFPEGGAGLCIIMPVIARDSALSIPSIPI